MSALTSTLAVAVLCYLFFLGQIGIHNCVHNTLFRSPALNRRVGAVLASLHLVHFEGWKNAHLQHHRYANTPRDPHLVDRSLLAYVATHPFRIARAVWQPTRFFAAVAPPILIATAVVVWQAASGRPLRGLYWVALFWLVPLIVSHALVAHFNYVTHVDLPSGRGRDTRNLEGGLWRLANALTFNFYLHREHHLWPSVPIPKTPHVPQRAREA